MKLITNPFLPLNVCIPDGEPHVFGNRVYLFGSHDKEGGDAFCMLDYECFSAPVDDLTSWRSEGVIYRATQDPTYSESYKYMYAPDVVQGNDGRFYLYYSLAGGCFTGPIHVAVCNTPAGQYEYYGAVQNHDGSVFNRNITFDPGLINDDGTIRLYYGWALAVDKQNAPTDAQTQMQQGISPKAMHEKMLQTEMWMFDKTREEVEREPFGIQGANVVTLADDMLTVIAEPVRIAPGQFFSSGSSFEGHAFFEASSIRKINGVYYFIYSSEHQHELCYATSKYPDKDFVYQGVIISNGDIGYQGRLPKDRLATTGNNHGSIEYINGEWYVFYHRQTHKTSFSRQACAEKIEMFPNGFIPQVEITSCGLNGGPLPAQGRYSATIACNLTDGNTPHTSHEKLTCDFPYITHEGTEQFITDITTETCIGFKYFAFYGEVDLEVCMRGNAAGTLCIYADDALLGKIVVSPVSTWQTAKATICTEGIKALYFKYQGVGKWQFKHFSFCGNDVE